ncbi:TetR/AcrR family transcriptional regulator [Actinomadura chibensis]|uniref:TetR/AcrR family transcriptional regulator n=1 Tax=Actinomadura chibensis TaxID=392828 RepID=A0A5D0NQ65_9ACTN|nr:TetR/AcrR family transcriptional regulator [Actinomadura chibensis]TYB46395.1 TetR/AcrR family transcriptional regulator [Actinomadura chibensis]
MSARDAVNPRPAPAGRRERNKERARERFYTAAITLFAEQGYDKTTVDDIAERADFARGTFFNYFQHKEDVIAEWVERRRKRLKEGLEANPHPENAYVVARLRSSLSLLAEVNTDEAEIAPALVTAWVKTGRPITEEPHTAEMFAEIVEQGRRQGEIDPDVDPQQVGGILLDCYLGVLFRWVQHGAAKVDLDRELQDVLKIITPGILARKS